MRRRVATYWPASRRRLLWTTSSPRCAPASWTSRARQAADHAVMSVRLTHRRRALSDPLSRGPIGTLRLPEPGGFWDKTTDRLATRQYWMRWASGNYISEYPRFGRAPRSREGPSRVRYAMREPHDGGVAERGVVAAGRLGWRQPHGRPGRPGPLRGLRRSGR